MNASRKSEWVIALLCLSILGNVIFVVKSAYFRIKMTQQPISVKPVQIKLIYSMGRNTIYQKFPVNHNDIVFIGDSHTEHFDVAEYLKGYPIKNRGIDKDVSAGVLNRIGQVTSGNPSKIFIEIGVNDLLWNHVSVDSLLHNIKAIVDEINSATKSKIYILSIFPTNYPEIKNSIQEYNRQVADYCAKNSIQFLNLYDQLAVNGVLNKKYDCGDHLHLNGDGYLVWA